MPYRPTERTEARKAQTRERVISAALDQVAEAGFASAGVQALAERAGVAVGTVYRHFPSKAELFAEVFRRASERELEVFGELAAFDGRGAAERVAAAAEGFCRRALAAPTLAYAQIAEPVDPAVEGERLRLRRGYRDVLAEVLREGIASGELRDHHADTVAAALVGALGEALVGPLSAGADKDELVGTLVRFCLESLPRNANVEALAA